MTEQRMQWPRRTNNVSNFLVIAKAAFIGIVGLMMFMVRPMTMFSITVGVILVATFVNITLYVVTHWDDGVTR